MITILLNKIPDSGFCSDYKNNTTCPYFDTEGGHKSCLLWDLLDISYTQEQMPDKVINTVCTWQKKVIV